VDPNITDFSVQAGRSSTHLRRETPESKRKERGRLKRFEIEKGEIIPQRRNTGRHELTRSSVTLNT